MANDSNLTLDRLREVLDYEPDTGVFHWRVAKTNSVRVGDIAGGQSVLGYYRICIDRHRYWSHRLAWFYIHGEWPPLQIDPMLAED